MEPLICAGDFHTRCCGHPCNPVTQRMAELGAQSAARSAARKAKSIPRPKRKRNIPWDQSWAQEPLPGEFTRIEPAR